MDPEGSRSDGSTHAIRRGRFRLRRVPWTTGVLILVIALASWPVRFGKAAAGLDPSWGGALSDALERGLGFGSDIAFTYGPLGFLSIGWPWYGPQTFLALVFVGLIHLGVCAVIVLGARRVMPFWQVAVVGYVAGRLTIFLFAYEGLMVLVFAACVALLLGAARRATAAPAWLVALGGIATSVGLLGKLNSGVFVGAMVLITTLALARPVWRGVAVLAVSVVVSLLAFWLVTGQHLADLVPYAANSYEIIRGYSQAMGVDRNPGLHWFLLAYPLGVLLLARLAGDEWHASAASPRVALVLIGGVLAFAFFKTGFVRWGLGYAFAALLVALFALVRPAMPRSLVLATFVAIALPAFAAVGSLPTTFLSPVTSATSAFRESVVALRPWTWAAREEKTRTELRAAYALEPPILAALAGQTVHVDPWQTGVLEAYPDLVWRPVPVFQSYTAYTSALDEMNAAVLRGPDPPTRILRETEAVWPGRKLPVPVAIDHRNRWFDGPAAMVQTFCRYDEVAATMRWEVLALTGRKCGPGEPLATVVARHGEAVTVPVAPPDRLIIVRVHGVDDSLGERLVSTLFKSPEWYVTLDAAEPYRLVPGTAVDGLLMAVPSSIVRSDGFAFEPAVRRISIAPRSWTAGARTLTYEFLSVPLTGG